jgi:hypothetical protein
VPPSQTGYARWCLLQQKKRKTKAEKVEYDHLNSLFHERIDLQKKLAIGTATDEEGKRCLKIEEELGLSTAFTKRMQRENPVLNCIHATLDKFDELAEKIKNHLTKK